MTTLHCQCGEPIGVHYDWTGHAYTARFTTAARRIPDNEITWCPRCDVHLYTALKSGQLGERNPPANIRMRIKGPAQC